MAVVADITVSLDGFVTGPDAGPDAGLGRGGEALHRWAVESDDPVDVEELRRGTEATGAVVMGRRLFDVVDGPSGWSDELGYGARHAALPPVFVVTAAPPAAARLGDRFRFVTDGLPAAVRLAGETAAGAGDVVVMGGARTVASAVDLGLVDRLVLHLAPLLLGAGTPLFPGARPRRLALVEVRPSGHATHVTYDVT